ncbi:MAG: hypothetical protein IJW97_01470 [Clostridia bacterium]|nr:hypothetical protein [Clostridia bacterium]
MKKRLPALLLAILLLLALPLSLGGCASDAPEVEQVYDIVVDLVERSYAANDLLYGYGIPVHAIGSALADINYLYNDTDFADYEYAHELSPYLSIAEIRDTLESVYSSDFLDSHNTTLFDGFFVGNDIVRARYYEKSEWLYQSVDADDPLITWQRIYDYSSMRVVKPSSATYVTVEIDSHIENDSTVLPVKLSIVYENGQWRLDTPTY